MLSVLPSEPANRFEGSAQAEHMEDKYLALTDDFSVAVLSDDVDRDVQVRCMRHKGLLTNALPRTVAASCSSRSC
jgi:hypothetical protein